MIIPSKHNGYTRDGVRRVYIDSGGGGGGGSTPKSTKQTVTQDLPDWARPYAKESLAKASALADSPYQVYGGERIAQFTPMQKQAFDRAGGQQVASQVGFGSGLAGLAGTTSFQDPGMAQGFMSPYMQNVVDRQMTSAQRQADIASTQRGAQAVRAGAFGGSRQAIENAEAQRALASQQGDIQARGLQSAFEQAQGQFNQEQATRLNAAQALGQFGQQQFGQEMDITGQQFGMGQQQRAATQDILSQQYQDFLNQQRAPFDNLAFMTSMLRGTPMGGTTAQYSTAPAPSQASQLIGLATAGAGAYGAYQGAQGRAAGGEVNSYAAGGIASLNQPQMAAMAGRMSDKQLGQTAEMPSITELARMTLDAEADERARMRQQATMQQAMMQQQPQTTVAEEQMAALGGISNLEAPNLEGMGEGMAGGGIVAFSPGGETSRFMQDDLDQLMSTRFSAGHTPLSDIRTAREREIEERNRRRAARLEEQYQADLAAQPQFEQAFFPVQRGQAQAASRAIDEGLASLAENKPLRPVIDAVKRGFMYSSDAEAQKAKAQTDRVTPASSAVEAQTATDRLRNVSRSAAKDEGKKRKDIAAVAAAEKAAAEQQNTVAAPAAPLPGLSSLQAQTAAGLTGLETQMGDINAARTAAAANQLERGKAQEAEMGEFGTEQEKRLQERAEGIKGSEGKNFNMALIEAGLAMMSGTSANAFENIGKGALVGTKAYTTGMERIQNRKEKLDDAMTALENAKRSDKRVSQERMDRLEANVDNAATANADAIYQFGKDRLGMTRQDAQFAVTTHLQQQQIAASNKKSFEERMVEHLGGGDLTKGYKAFKALGAKPADLMGEFNDFVKANAMSMATLPQDQQIAAFMRTKMMFTGTDKPVGKVRE